MLKHFLDSDLKEIRIFSRDEKKQDDMRHELQAKHPEAVSYTHLDVYKRQYECSIYRGGEGAAKGHCEKNLPDSKCL